MKYKNWTGLMIALSLLVSFSIVMPQIQPVSHAASTDSSPRNLTDAVPYAKPVPDSGAPNPPPPALDPAIAVLYPDELDHPSRAGCLCAVPLGRTWRSWWARGRTNVSPTNST